MIFPTLILNIERWKYNKEYEVYVSNLGHFKSKSKKNLSFKINDYGYCMVKTGAGTLKLAHRLVLLTWRPIPNAEDLTIDHLNHNKRDNTLKNLEWVSKVENQERAKRDYIQENIKSKKISKEVEEIKLTINDIHFNTIAEGYKILCDIYPCGYPKGIFEKAVKNIKKGKNTAGQKKLGQSAILAIKK